MAKLSFDDGDGVWRTIGGRRVFIREGQSLSDAMKKSGKFKSAKKKGQRKFEDVDKDFHEHAQKMEKNYEEFGGNSVEDERKLNELSRERDKALLNKDDTFLEQAKLLDKKDKGEITEREYFDKTAKLHGKEPNEARKEVLKNMERLGVEKPEYLTKESNYRSKITDVAKNSKEDNVTLDVETGKPVSFEKGYSVSFQQSSDNYSDEEYHAKVEECRNKCDGKVYAGKYGGDAEASFHTDSLEDAKELMYKYNQESIYDWKHDTLIMNDKYNASTNKTNYKEEKTTNDYMNDKIRRGASKNKFKEDLPKKTEIKTQGTSNRKEVSENIQAHILDYYDKPEDFIQQMDAMDYLPTKWHAGEELAKGGSYMVYYDEQREFLDNLKINPNGKKFSDDRVFQTYTSLIGRESAKLYDRLKKNAYRKYMKEHPNSKMSFGEFKDMTKGGK